MFGMLVASLFFIALGGFSAAGFAKFCKKLWAWLRLRFHPGFRVGKTWIDWPTTTGSIPMLLKDKGFSVTLAGRGRTLFVPILTWDATAKMTIDQQSQEDEIMVPRKHYDEIMQVVAELLPDLECEE